MFYIYLYAVLVYIYFVCKHLKPSTMIKYIALVLGFIAPLALSAQTETTAPPPVPVEVSTNKVKIGGDSYYVHIVQPGQTLYSISRAYGVSQSEIAAANPDIYAELKAGQALKIPVKEQHDDGERYIYHIAKRRETLYSIAKQYNVSQERLLELNPALKDGLKRSQVVLVPRYDTPPAPDTLTYLIHEVQRGEGLYGISRRYSVTPRDIELLNREQLVDGLRPGMQLRIPKPTLQQPEPRTISLDALIKKPTNTFQYDGRAFNVAMLLPFTQPSSAALSDEGSSGKRRSAFTESSLEFYEGFLLALDSVKRLGVSVNLTVHDTKKQPVEVGAIARGGALSNADLIVGPFFVDELLPLAHYATDAGLNIVSPSYNGPTAMPPGTIVINQTFREQFESFVNRLDISPDVNYIVLYDAASTYSTVHRFCDSVLQQKFAPTGVALQRYGHVTNRPSGVAQDSIRRHFDLFKNNVVIIPSEDEPFVAEILGNVYGVISSLTGGSSIVYGPARWMRMKNIPSEYLYKTNLHIYSPFFVDYHQPNVRKFVGDYRETFRAEPSQLSFLGYDLGLYFLTALKTYGAENLREFLSQHQIPSLQMNCVFKLDNRGVLRNVGQIEVQYLRSNETVIANQ